MLFLLRQNGDHKFLQAFSELLLQRLLEAAVAGAADHDKIKSNSVRALGLLGRILEAHTLSRSHKTWQHFSQDTLNSGGLFQNFEVDNLKDNWVGIIDS